MSRVSLAHLFYGQAYHHPLHKKTDESVRSSVYDCFPNDAGWSEGGVKREILDFFVFRMCVNILIVNHS
jgi:hypothetical protein